VYLTAKAHVADRKGQHSEAARLLREARHYARKLASLPLPVSRAAAAMLEAAIAWAEDDEERALDATRRALDEARAHPILAFEHALRLRVGELMGGSAGTALIDEATQQASSQGVSDLECFALAGIPTAGVAG
jgi:hypothetical protein